LNKRGSWTKRHRNERVGWKKRREKTRKKQTTVGKKATLQAEKPQKRKGLGGG